MLCFLLFCFLCSAARHASAQSAAYTLEPFAVQWDNHSLLLSVAHVDEPLHPVLATSGKGTAFVRAAFAKTLDDAITNDGGYNCGFKADAPLARCEQLMWQSATQTGHVEAHNASTLTIVGELRATVGHGKKVITQVTSYELTLSVGRTRDVPSNAYLRAHVALLPPRLPSSPHSNTLRGVAARPVQALPLPNRLTLVVASAVGERLFGFGQQYSKWDQKGTALPLLVSEQGIGRGLEPLTAAVNTFGGKTGGSSWTTYGPAPLFLAAAPSAACGDGNVGGDFGKIEGGPTSPNCSVAYRAVILEDGPNGEAPVTIFDSRRGSASAADTGGQTIDIRVWGEAMALRVLYAPTAMAASAGASVLSPTPAPEASALSSPLLLLRGISDYTGRMQPLPQWTSEGAIIGLEGGKDHVLNITSVLLAAGVPISALWVQDWTGVRHMGLEGDRLWWNWESDDHDYPGWDQMVCDLRSKQGVRMLSYVNPFLVNATAKSTGFRRNLLQEASDAGYLVQKPRQRGGGNYMLKSGSFEFGTVDLSSHSASAWFTEVIVDNMLLPSRGDKGAAGEGCGVSGWMHDFGEYLPMDAALDSGEDASSWHNRFPVVWAELAHNATKLVAARRSQQQKQYRERRKAEGLGAGAGATTTGATAEAGDDTVFFVRSSWTRSPSHARLFWQGDQLASWDDKDGLRTVLLGLLSGGLSGRSLSHSDVGGYMMVDEKVEIFGQRIGCYYMRDNELLQRWAELSAFADAVMRTHPGVRPTETAQVWSSNASVAAFARMAKVHVALDPYRRALMAEAATTGAPLARPLFAHFQADVASLGVWSQFMLGPELMVAPVLDANPSGAGVAANVAVYFPPLPTKMGKWVHLWSGVVVNGTGTSAHSTTVAAQLGRPPVFYMEHSPQGAAIAAQILAAVGP